jgi:Protein of unknown function (DUF3300)
MKIWPSTQVQRSLAIVCAVMLAPYQSFAWQQAQAGDQQQKLLSPEQLDSLVAPIALYPDPLLSQVLVASTYPLEIVEAGRWLQQNSNVKGQALTNAVAQKSWDASVQALVVFPDVLQKLDQNISWTTDLGNAFLAQQSDVMQAIQRLRQTARENGKLKSTPQQEVTTGVDNNVSYIAIQPADPQVIYVPQYDPVGIWGPPPAYYPYPAFGYPSTGAAIAASAISFGTGVALGALWSGGGWGWGFGWGGNNVIINNNFINRNRFNRANVTGNNVWRHNPAHRAGVPYGNRNVAGRFNPGGNTNRINRPTAGQTQQRLGEAGRQMGPGNIGQPGRQFGRGQGMQQPGQGSAQRLQGPNQPNRGALGGQERMGNRQLGGGNFAGGRSAFSDMNQGRGRAQMNTNRGFSSMGGGGFRAGGGGGVRGNVGGFRGGGRGGFSGRGGFGGGGRGGGGGRRR